MTTYAHTLTLDDSERIALAAILERSIAANDMWSIEAKAILDSLNRADMQMTSTSTFGR